MKNIKKIIVAIFLVLSLFLVKANAQEGYLEADGILKYDENNYVTNITSYLNQCKMRGLDAKFSNKEYVFTESFVIPDGISLLGSEGTVFKGVNLINNEYQLNIFDSSTGTSNIEIRNIIFDNFTIYSNQSNNSNNWIIENNVFVNAKKVDLSIDSGLKPDSNNQNGGENTGYYILLANNDNSVIRSNLFLRDSNSLGRGVATYKTNNTVIEDNYFGILEDLDNSIVSFTTKSLSNRLDKVKLSNDNQGYFMTGINCVNGDKNLVIKGNHMSFNKDLFEVQYEDRSLTSDGYHRDHLIYAKGYTNLEVVGNYFKGQTKNQDGGIKFRNGDGLFINKNVLDDTLLLLYVQPGDSILKNVYVTDNVFNNRTQYISDKIEYANPKYISQSFLVLVYNYVSGSDMSNITIKNNKILSFGLNNEEIRVISLDADLSTWTIADNNNLLGNPLVIKNTTTQPNNQINGGSEYSYNSKNDYSSINVDDLVIYDKIDYRISNQTIITEAKIYSSDKLEESLKINKNDDSKLYLILEETDIIIIDDINNYMGFVEYSYATNRIMPINLNVSDDIKLPSTIILKEMDTIDLNDYINNFSLYEIVMNHANAVLNDGVISVNEPGEYDLIISIGGFEYTIHVIKSSGVLVPSTPTTPTTTVVEGTNPPISTNPSTSTNVEEGTSGSNNGCIGSLNASLVSITSLGIIVLFIGIRRRKYDRY